MQNRDAILAGICVALIFTWAIFRRYVPADLGVLYLIALLPIALSLVYLVFIQARLQGGGCRRMLLMVAVMTLGIVAFCHSILRLNLLKLVANGFK